MGPAQFVKALVKVLCRDSEASTRREGLDRQAPIHELSQHSLNRVNFVDDVKVAFLVDHLVEGASKLLHWMDQDLLTLPVHLEALGEGFALPLYHSLTSQNHVGLNLVLEDFDLTRCLIVLVDDVLVGLVSLLLYVDLDQVLEGLDLIGA